MSESKTTTVVIPKTLRNDLDVLKVFERETYADVIGRLVHIAKEDDETGLELSEATKKKLARAEEDFKHGRIYTSAQMRKELGL